MGQAFIENPVLALFLVIALGYGLGRVRIGNFRLGIAAVLFVGLAFGGIFKNTEVPSIMVFFGLSLFVYCIGLASGPSFFTTIKTNGVRDVGFVVTMLALTASITVGLSILMGLDPQTSAGLYAGSTTNTPALAGLIDLIGQTANSAESAASIAQEAVAGYSIAYPMGILGTIAAFSIIQRAMRIDYSAEVQTLKDTYPIGKQIINERLKVTNEEIKGITIRDLKQKYGLNVIFGRRVRGGETTLTNWDNSFRKDDITVVVGDRDDVSKAVDLMGELVTEIPLSEDTDYVIKRIFVSNPEIAGQTLSALNIMERYEAIVTRIRRGDMDILASQDTVLELGDIVNFITRRKDAPGLEKLFGDSYESLGSINLFAFGFGLSIGIMLGMVTFQLPGGLAFKLGFAVGPVIIGLVLGALRRTGPIVWTLPYSANLTFRQLGLAILLGGIGINSGGTFFSTIVETTGLYVLAASAIISFVSAAITLIVGYKVVKLPFSILGGMVAHQPAILDFALTQSKNKLPNLGFTLMLPIAIILKILFVQLLYLYLS